MNASAAPPPGHGGRAASGQVVFVNDDAPGPAAYIAAHGTLARVALAGAFDWTVAPARTCIGRIDDLRHTPCPTEAPVSIHSQCDACSGMPDATCIFEPRCQRQEIACQCEMGQVPHVVYLAFYGTLAKVGMTAGWRVARRLREQGADAWMLVESCADRGAARRLEQQISYLHHVPEYRSHREVLPQLARPVPWPQIEARAAAWRVRLADRASMPGGLERITDHPIAQPLGGTPRRVQAEGRHRGEWLGVKGSHLIYRSTGHAGAKLDAGVAGPFAALKRSELVGRTVTFASPGPA